MSEKASKRGFPAGWQIALIILVLLSGLGYLFVRPMVVRQTLFATSSIDVVVPKQPGMKFSAEAYVWEPSDGQLMTPTEVVVEDASDHWHLFVPRAKPCLGVKPGEHPHPELRLEITFYKPDPEDPKKDLTVNETLIRATDAEEQHYDLKLTDQNGEFTRHILLKNGEPCG